MAFEFLDRWQHKGNEFFGNLITKLAIIGAGVTAAYFGIKWLGDKAKHQNTPSDHSATDTPITREYSPPSESLTPPNSPASEQRKISNERGR